MHYLRTTNPLNPEVLAAYPRRVGSNRPNAYGLPGLFDKLPGGNIPVFENRQCGRGAPVISQEATPLLEQLFPQTLLDNLNAFALPATSSGQTPAPSCNLQQKFTFQGKTTQYPRVEARDK